LAADAPNVEPPKAIAAAAKPIAILRIMMLTPFALSTPAFPNQTQRFAISCSSAAQLLVSDFRIQVAKTR
jgi:hypothetical protein